MCFSVAETWSQLNTLNSECPSSKSLPASINYLKTQNAHQQAFQLAWSLQFSWLHATANLVRLLHPSTRFECSHLSDGFRNWKTALCKIKCFRKYESLLCHKHAVTMLTQPSHSDDQLKEWLKSQKAGNRNCLRKIVQSISYLYRQRFAGCKGKQDKISSNSSFSVLKTMK